MIFRLIKEDVSRSAELAELLWYFDDREKIYKKYDRMGETSQPGYDRSHAQKVFDKQHKIKEEDGYLIVRNGNGYKVSTPEGNTYYLNPTEKSVCVGRDCR